MKPAIDPAVVSAIAFAVLSPQAPRCDFGGSIGADPITEDAALAAASVLHVVDLGGNDDQRCSAVLDAAGPAFAFGLYLGARIGSDPAHFPEVKDLIKQYRFNRKEAA